jgi:hypothetical protein
VLLTRSDQADQLDWSLYILRMIKIRTWMTSVFMSTTVFWCQQLSKILTVGNMQNLNTYLCLDVDYMVCIKLCINIIMHALQIEIILDIFYRYCCFVALLAFRHFFWKGTQVLIRSILTTLCPLLLFCVYLPESCFPLFKYPVLYLTMFHSSVVRNISTIDN